VEYPKIYIVILNWNGLHDTLQCLQTVYNMDYANYEVIVVDNASTDGSNRVIPQEYPEVIYLRNEINLGYTGGNNIAIRHALNRDAEYVWLLNNDTAVEPDCLRKIVEVAESAPEIGLVSPLVCYYDNPEIIQFCGNFVDWEKHDFIDVRQRPQLPDTPLTLWGTALLAKRALVETIGLFNENFFAYYEDQEYSLRTLNAGFKTRIVTEARVYHKDSRSTGSSHSPLATFLRTRNRYLLWRDIIQGKQWKRYRREFLADVIMTSAELRRQGFFASAEACLDGFWSGVVGDGGNRCDTRPMSRPLKRILLFFCSHAPYLWGGVLKGRLGAVATECRKRILKKEADHE